MKILMMLLLIIFLNFTHAETTAYEGFDYALGDPLTGLDGGSGWSSAWTTNGGAGGTVVSGLSFTDVTGNQLVRNGGAYGVNASRSYYQTIRDTNDSYGAADTTVWMSFIIQQASVITGVNYGMLTLGTGYTFGSNAMLAGIGGATARPIIGNFYGSSGGVSDTTLTMLPGESAFIVLRFDFTAVGNDTLNLWYNPVLGGESGEPILTYSGKNYASIISGLTLAHGDYRSFVYDELRIGTDFASVTPIRSDDMFIDGFE